MINRRQLTNMAMFFAIALTIIGTTFIVRSEEARHQQELRTFALSQLSSVRAKLEGIINSTLFLARGVVAYIASHPEINQEEFHQLAKELLLQDTHIRNMALAKDNVITHMYPIKGNEAAVGLRYMDHPKQRRAVLRAIETKRTVVAGPLNLVQGGTGFISRTPVFLTTSGKKPGSGDYWGIVSMVINMDSLFEEAGISNEIAKRLRIAIRGKDGLGAEGGLFFGDEIVFKADPVILDVTLPEGSWQIAAIPEKGWSIVSDRAAFFKFSGLLLSIALGLSIWLMGRLSEERERRKSEEATAEADRQVKELADSLSEVVYRADAQTFKTLYINNAVEKIFGHTVEEWLESHELWKESILAEDKERVFEILEDAKKNGKDLSYEYRIMRKDRMIRWVEDRITWKRDDEGNVVSLNGLLYDITERKESEEELHKSQNDMQAIFNNMQDTFYRTDINGYITMLSPSASELMKCDKEELMGQKLDDFYEDPKGREKFIKSLEEAGGRLKNYEARIKRKDSSIIWVSTNSHYLYDESNNVTGVEGAVRNITEQKRAEEELSLLKKAIDTTRVGITIADLKGKIIYSNPAEALIHGYSKEELVGRDVSIFSQEEKRQHLDLEVVKKADPKRHESINLRKDGSSFPVYLTSDIVTNSSDDPIGLVTLCEDITDRKKAENELKTSREQLRNLTKALQSTREEERKKIAREIHDELGQSLTALKIDLSLLKRKLPRDATALHKRAGTMTEIVDLTLQSVKRIAKQLRPEILDELGLEAATRWYIKEFNSRSVIKCGYTIVGPCDNTSKDISLALFRIFQEATTNIIRHSKATRARIYLECKENNLLLKISDNGKGINKKDISDPMSIGLVGMNERILSVGGHFSIRGICGVGTSVKVYITGKATKK